MANPARIARSGRRTRISCSTRPRYQGASILLARSNFGCGSSREHAPWALHDFGFRAIIGRILRRYLFQQLLQERPAAGGPAQAEIDALFGLTEHTPGYRLTVDLPAQVVLRPDGHAMFAVDAFRKECMLNGWDDIGLTLRHAEKIRDFEARRRIEQPWLFA
jgi:3-isopropylmalate/(R)-2-methylmalate dehydratase small subunit